MARKSNRKLEPDGTAASPPAPPPVPTERERAAITAAGERNRKRQPRFSIAFGAGKTGEPVDIQPSHDDVRGWIEHLHGTFGTQTSQGSKIGAFAITELNRMLNFVRDADGKIDATSVNALLAAIDGMQPADELEAMLAVQMAVTHAFALECVRRAKRADLVPQLEAHGSLAVKLLRTYTAQLEVLHRMRRGGEQVVRVERVNVMPGGQAIVGNVTHGSPTGGGGNGKSEHQPHAPDEEIKEIKSEARSIASEPGAPMPGPDAQRQAVPSPGGQDKAPLPDARRRSRQRGP